MSATKNSPFLTRETNISSEKIQKEIDALAKAHCIWIRDELMHQYPYCSMPWPLANLMGKVSMIAEFTSFFNPNFAEGMLANAQRMMDEETQWGDNHLSYGIHPSGGIYTLDVILKDYFKPGEEGFNFPVDASVKDDEAFFERKIADLKEWFPHLANVSDE